MLAERDPREAYRRVEIDARVQGSSPAELVGLCYEQFVVALGSAIRANERSDNQMKSHWLTRALSALFALEMGVDRNSPLGPALLQVYHAGRDAILDSVTRFDAHRIAELRVDFIEIAEALQSARAQAA